MNRRSLLASVAAGAVVAGCLGADPSSGADPGAGDDEPPASDECGVAAEPLSALLTDGTGDPSYCFEGAQPGLTIANERDDPIEASIAVATFEERYDLDPGERVVEHSAFEAADDLTVTVTVGDEEYTRTWTERSCYRHGIAITDEGVTIGRIEPLQGPGDTQHDCYPGKTADVWIGTEGPPRAATVTVDDRCDGTSTSQTIEVDRSVRVEDVLTSGGNYDVAIDVHAGGSDTYEYREECWGLMADIEVDGTVTIYKRGID
ncbi:hypothetical protein [Halosolutus halophilus]|uniref:hypothetical protein n=1 Tax=Halosolutus halophilus TaxID=1552990 RepID=UPI0022351F72|nr:hypothetical protein [Halosolutus halophilus]